MVSAYFHLYAAGQWETPTREFLEAMVDSGLAGEARVLHLGLIGSEEQRDDAWSFCRRYVDTRIIVAQDEGWEQPTLEAMRQNPVGDHLLYCHTKGAAVVDEWQDAWRRSMYLSLVTEWRKCVPWLEEYDTVGDHWLLPSPGMPQQFPFYGGNCFWTRRSYLERLGPPAMNSRYDAEAYIGSGEGVNAQVRQGGWPGWDSIRQEVRRPPGAPL
jgi:hypothetical protein